MGKTLFEVFRDKDEAVGEGGINHQQYYSGEFDIEWGQTITEEDKFKKKEMDEFKTWLKKTDYFPEYAGRSIADVQLWQLSEKSPDLDTPYNERPKVTKRELKKTHKGTRKSKRSRVKKKEGKHPGNKLQPK